jgi:hypothetical protein
LASGLIVRVVTQTRMALLAVGVNGIGRWSGTPEVATAFHEAAFVVGAAGQGGIWTFPAAAPPIRPG